jgi:hypothetical protein
MAPSWSAAPQSVEVSDLAVEKLSQRVSGPLPIP